MGHERTQHDFLFPLHVAGVVRYASADGDERGEREPKNSLHESARPGKIEAHGTLAHETNGNGHGWNKNGVSVKSRIRSGEISQAKIDQFTNSETLERYFIPADDSAPMRCVDGRTSTISKKRIDGGEQITDERAVAPMIPGGTPGSALVHRIISNEEPAGKTLTRDIRDIVAEFDSLGIQIGGHIDEDEHDDRTGCGAIDKIPEIFDILSDEGSRTQIHKLTKDLLGNNFDPGAANEIFKKTARLHDHRDHYLERKGNKFPYRPQTMKILREHNPNTVETMVGRHNEVALVVNTVSDTTLNRAKLNQDSKGAVQVFNYDVWTSVRIAEKLYPGDERMQKLYLTGRVMLAIAIMMALTDGSLRLMVRVENGKKPENKKNEPAEAKKTEEIKPVEKKNESSQTTSGTGTSDHTVKRKEPLPPIKSLERSLGQWDRLEEGFKEMGLRLKFMILDMIRTAHDWYTHVAGFVQSGARGSIRLEDAYDSDPMRTRWWATGFLTGIIGIGVYQLCNALLIAAGAAYLWPLALALGLSTFLVPMVHDWVREDE